MQPRRQRARKRDARGVLVERAASPAHRNGYLYPLRDHGRPEELDAAQESYGFDDSEEVPVELEAG